MPPDIDYASLANLLDGLYHSEEYRVCLDLSAVSRLGTVEFRVLGIFAEMFKRRGGFLILENATDSVAALVRVFGFSALMPGTNDGEFTRKENLAPS